MGREYRDEDESIPVGGPIDPENVDAQDSEASAEEIEDQEDALADLLEFGFDYPHEHTVANPMDAVIGVGAEAGATVELWDMREEAGEGGALMDTTVADSQGNWIFAGATPLVVGVNIIQAKSGDQIAEVAFEVVEDDEDEETEPEADEEDELSELGRDWDDMTTHAQIDAYAADLVRPQNWTSLTIAQKKAWLAENTL